MSQGKTAKGKTSKYRTVDMSKGSKTKSDMKQDGTAKQVLSHWSHAAARGFNPDALASRVSIFAVADSRGWAGHAQ
jgi:hypothetical protein